MFSKLRKINIKFKPVLYNRYVLYFFLLLSLLEMVIFMNTGDTTSLFVFLLVGILISFFNKNMIVIMCIALVITNILKYGIKEFREGFEGTEDEEKEKETESITNKNEDKEIDKKMADPKTATKKATATDLKEDFGEFTDIQEKINEGMQKMEPLLNKADSFIQKYEHLLNK